MITLANSNFNTSELWQALGTFYQKLSNEEKEKIEALWYGIFQGTLALEYNLLESYYVNFLAYTKGYIENNYKSLLFDINTVSLKPKDALHIATASVSGAPINPTTYEYFLTGVQVLNNQEFETNVGSSYTVISDSDLSNLPITLTWADASSFHKLRLYKLNNDTLTYFELSSSLTQFVDDSSEEFVAISSLPEINTTIDYFLLDIDKNTLYVSGLKRSNKENLICELYNYDKLKIYAFDYMDKEELELEVQIILAPIFDTIFKELFYTELNYNNEYTSYLIGSTTEEQAKYNAQHLLKLCHAIFFNLKKGLTINRLATTLSLYYNVPFSYESGIVAEYSSNTVTISGNHVYTYEFPDDLTVAVSSGQTVPQFYLLTKGVSVEDYISNASIMPSGHAFYNTVGIHVPDAVSGLSYSSYVRSDLLNNVLPPNCTFEYF